MKNMIVLRIFACLMFIVSGCRQNLEHSEPLLRLLSCETLRSNSLELKPGLKLDRLIELLGSPNSIDEMWSKRRDGEPKSLKYTYEVSEGDVTSSVIFYIKKDTFQISDVASTATCFDPPCNLTRYSR